MKISFSTKGWHGYLWEDFTRIATEQGFNGIELHNVNNPSFTEKNGAFYMSSAQATVRELYEKNLRIPCIDTLKNPAAKEEREAFLEELSKCLQIASTLHIPFVRIKATDTGADFEEQNKKLFLYFQTLFLKQKRTMLQLLLKHQDFSQIQQNYLKYSTHSLVILLQHSGIFIHHILLQVKSLKQQLKILVLM